ncbi:NfeD family protein [Frigoribacterium sp. SL97]|uniref:NfeD family protein n=1 Tax=Frigoribacterium sp. SL97 TaxID=2994664 RepID=UPI002271F332|nr:NfeD family protein [Frigoribacterium sp. SL97]WAC52128.1 NfeD family protein [Frigoribacterium sp. SL97]
MDLRRRRRHGPRRPRADPARRPPRDAPRERGHWSPVGFVGVTTEATGPAGGEVRLDDVRELERRLATSDARIERGVRVRVVAENGPRVQVEALDAGETSASRDPQTN